MISRCKLDADLVGPAGVQPDSDKRNVRLFAICQNLVGQQRPLHILAGLLHDARFAQRPVIPQKVFHLPGAFPEAPMGCGEVFLFKFARAHLLGQNGRCRLRAGKDHQPRNLRVEPVDRAHAGVLIGKLFSQQVNHAALVVSRRDHACGLDAHEDARILI